MKPQRIRELVLAGMGGDVSGWEPCPERVGDGPARRLPVGDWFTLGRSSEGTVLYYDDGFSMEMAVDSYGPEGTFSGPGCEVVFGAFGGRRTHIEPDREELERFMRLTFYRAPSPDAPVYVEEGKSVKKGDPLCILEAMKMMNTLESEFDCTVEKILVQNGDLVEFDQPLFLVRKN